MSQRLGDLLVKEKVITQEQLEQATKLQKDTHTRLASALVKLGFLSDEDVTNFLSRQYGVPAINLSYFEIDPAVVKLIPYETAKRYQILPLSRVGASLTIAMVDPTNVFAMDDIKFMTGFNIEPVVASESSIIEGIDKAYGTSKEAELEQVMQSMNDAGEGTDIELQNEEQELELKELEKAADEAPIVKLVNLVLTDAVKRGASDIHMEPYEKEFRVRFRIDGVLQLIMNPPLKLKDAITSRLKIMAKLDISEKRLPQDGRIEIKIADRLVDIRVSVIPTAFGERVVLRLLDKTANILMLSDLGMHDERIKLLNKLIKSPYGIILVTGPTGSGKTTTLYAALSTINHPEINIITIEDPIEYQMDGVGQIQVNPKIDLTFAAGLRSIVRQDPDVILIGEIRDRETAEIAIQSSLTGHLVFSTLHTNDAASAITRLIDMGIEPFLATSSIIAIIAQRLVRVLCPHCKEIYVPDEETLDNLGLNRSVLQNNIFYRKKGCNLCMQTGFRGRTAIFEILIVDEEIKRLVLKTSDANQINELALKQGMITLQKDGIDKVLHGMTTTEEVLRVTRSLNRKDDIVLEI